LVIAAALAALRCTASAGVLAASTTIPHDLLPRPRRGRGPSDNGDVHTNRIATRLLGLVGHRTARVVNDQTSPRTVAYNLLVGGMLIPLIGAINWKRAPTAGAITIMT
ncbi:sodium:solute symporter, partial [Pseudomonas aeruginosa]